MILCRKERFGLFPSSGRDSDGFEQELSVDSNNVEGASDEDEDDCCCEGMLEERCYACL